MNNFNLSNKSVIISGGGTGIGLQIAKSFIAQYSKVTIVGRRKNILDNATAEIIKEFPEANQRIFSYSCDMSDEKKVEDLFNKVKSHYKNIDIVVNNCGIWSISEICDINENDIDDHFNNIFKPTVLSTKFAKNYMNNLGSIINVSSFASILPMKNASLYSSIKSAINSFTKSSAQELGDLGIRINCVIPGVIKTPMTSKYINDNYDKILEPIALGRIGTCEEVANGVLFLCSDMASYITGSTLEITGGKYVTQV